MNQKIFLITGANTGIGYATALGLAEMDHTVVMVARSVERGEKAQASRLTRAARITDNIALAQKLWAVSAAMVGL